MGYMIQPLRFVFWVPILFSISSYSTEFKSDVVYGGDGRCEPGQVWDPAMRELARGSVAIVSKEDVIHLGKGVSRLKTESYGETNELCPEERYYDQPSIPFCSGSLISDDVILTAGHCMSDANSCEDSLFVFDFTDFSDSRHAVHLPAAQIYGCKEIIAFGNSTKKPDFALVRLDRKVYDRDPLEIASPREESELESGSGVFAIGHPQGLPTKFSLGGKVRRVYHRVFTASLDVFFNNSGSPVLDEANHKVVGILVAGEDDFEKAPKRNCNVTKRCSESGCRGESITRVSQIRDYLH